MRNFLYQTLKLLFLLFVALGVVGAVAFYNFQNKESQKVYAGVGDNVTGYAWSENIGWISFNNTNPGAGGANSYGVNIIENSSGVGILSGYAWSENIGWITFNRTVAGAPPNNDVGAVYNALAYIDGSNKLQGWARATTACDNTNDGDCIDTGSGEGVGAGANSGGWDGWIRFNNNSTYGWTLNPAAGTSYFTGWAWGSDVLGWLSSNNATGGGGTVYRVGTTFELNLPPNAPSALGVTSKYCSAYNSLSTYLTFNWTFTDPNLNSSNSQSKYKIDISYPGFSYSTGEVNQSVANGGTGSGIVYLSDLGSWYSQTLNWTVTVWDNGTYPKSASASSTYAMQDREYPYVTFYSNPALDKIFAKQDVQFSPDQFSADTAKCYSSGSTEGPCGSYSWSFSGAANPTPTSSTQKDPVVNFESSGSANATLTITDGAGHSCQASRSINTGLPLPEIKEKKQ